MTAEGPALLDWIMAVFYNSVGRYRDALPAAQRASEDPFETGVLDVGPGRA